MEEVFYKIKFMCNFACKKNREKIVTQRKHKEFHMKLGVTTLHHFTNFLNFLCYCNLACCMLQNQSYLDQELEDLKVDLEMARTRRYFDNEVY